ncbi:MAG: hypothetical protein A3A86_03600 [Elusimicrobia bacterium RIFCSPLOWO2_01_FULL_60_11]|nr:MAG: hypothetical protein A3A86_03600 [Elusimicrobia bacterium RIFCSPLOWO2_01_FULL_60_11]
MLKKTAFLTLILGLFSPFLQAADPLDSLARQVARGLKNSGLKSAAVMEFQYLDGGAGLGGPKMQGALVEALAKAGVAVSSIAAVEAATSALGLNPQTASKKDESRTVARKLGAQAVILGDIKDLRSKVELHAVSYETSTGKIVGGGAQTLRKTWKDPVSDCGELRYFALTNAPAASLIAPESVKFVFAQPWWPAKPIGKISWNFCKKDGKTPSVNDALPELKLKAAAAGGDTLQILKSDPDPGNLKVLKIEALILR